MKKAWVIALSLVLITTILFAFFVNNINKKSGYAVGGGPPPPPCLDSDGDNFNYDNGNSNCGPTFDCNDNNGDIYPGAPELCDGVDNQCPGDIGYGIIDENCNPPCLDIDGDGYNTSHSNNCGPLDCNDNNANIHPGATEFCNNIDDDCDNTIDEGCPSCTDYDVNYADPHLNKSYIDGYSEIGNPQTYFIENDSCADSTILNERKCRTFHAQHLPDVETYDCSLENKICNNGACISSGCVPNWTAHQTPCINETYKVYYTDENNCNLQEPANETHYCEDGNFVIGDYCNWQIDNVKINSTNYNSSENYTGIGNQVIELKESNASVLYYWNFSKDILNICPIEIKTQSSNNPFGYAIIKNTNATGKTVYFDKISPISNNICIKDKKGVTSVNSFGNCTSSDEILLSCPGTANVSNYIYHCEIIGNQFKVWPLKHSALKEMLPITQNQSGCIANWSCSDWSDCNNGVETRTCTDLNNCNDTNTPSESQTCEEECIPQWSCGWGTCQSNGLKYYSCEDVNNCGDIESRPIKHGETFECKKQWKSLFVIIIAIIGIILAILAAIYFVLKNKAKKQQQDEMGITGIPTQPPQPPYPPQTPQINQQPAPTLPPATTQPQQVYTPQSPPAQQSPPQQVYTPQPTNPQPNPNPTPQYPSE